jgi:hypothetical protein
LRILSAVLAEGRGVIWRGVESLLLFDTDRAIAPVSLGVSGALFLLRRGLGSCGVAASDGGEASSSAESEVLFLDFLEGRSKSESTARLLDG